MRAPLRVACSPSEFAALRKAELHVHLEGTVSPHTLLELAEQSSVDPLAPVHLPGVGKIPLPSGFRPGEEFSFQSFDEFIACYLKISETIKSGDQLVHLVRRYAESAVSQNICGSDIYFSSSTFLAFGRDLSDLFDGLRRGEAAATALGVQINWIFDVVRNAEQGGEKTVELACIAREQGVSVKYIGLGGKEAGFPATLFAPAFRLARERGFRILAHAGETAGAESIWQTLESLNPDRIGHGIAALEDPRLVEELRRRDTCLEVSPWSNVLLQIVAADEHPLQRMIDAGLKIVLSADDPGIFGKDLLDNYQFAAQRGVSHEALSQIAARSVEIFGS